MNILKIALPDGLHNTRCLHASPYENWLSEEHAFHASPSTPSPCNHDETDYSKKPEYAWHSCVHIESDTRYSFAMRCVVVKSTNRLGTHLSRAYNTTYDPPLDRPRYHPRVTFPLSFVSADDYNGLQGGWQGQDVQPPRHDVRECLDCQTPDNSQHPANGDVCLIMQMHTHPEFDQCPDYSSSVQQFMLVTRVLTLDSVGVLH
jgi:hypothetical protein